MTVGDDLATAAPTPRFAFGGHGVVDQAGDRGHRVVKEYRNRRHAALVARAVHSLHMHIPGPVGAVLRRSGDIGVCADRNAVSMLVNQVPIRDHAVCIGCGPGPCLVLQWSGIVGQACDQGRCVVQHGVDRDHAAFVARIVFGLNVEVVRAIAVSLRRCGHIVVGPGRHSAGILVDHVTVGDDLATAAPTPRFAVGGHVVVGKSRKIRSSRIVLDAETRWGRWQVPVPKRIMHCSCKNRDCDATVPHHTREDQLVSGAIKRLTRRYGHARRAGRSAHLNV